jgi:hypothetical protein
MKKCVFDRGNTCGALVPKDCEKCTFRKTRSELIEGRENARALLAGLPEQRLAQIKKKYYSGKETGMW